MKKKILALILGFSLTTSAFSLYLVVLGAVGGITVGVTTGVFVGQSTEKKKQNSDQALAKYMQSNHASLVRDISMGRGPMVTEWGANIGLNTAEQQELENRLEGSKEQMEMLKALSDNIEIQDARAFSRSLVTLVINVIGRERTEALLPKPKSNEN
ncbi:MAG: hypothetical protein ABUK01_18730 [Leptospirales bacterium]